MRAFVLIFVTLAVVLGPSAAAANQSVGLIVNGEVLKGPTQNQAEKWLRAHVKKVVTNPLPKDAVKTLLDCLVIDDPKCARGLVDARAVTDSLVSIRIDVVSKKDKDVRLTIDWFTKGRNPVSSRRTCEDCSEAVLRTTIDAMLLDLAKQSPGFMGRIKVVSTPPGITVLIDNETIGVTPIERDIAAGTHKARLVRDGRMGSEKDVNVEAGALAEVTLEAPPVASIVEARPPPPPSKRSRWPAVGLMIVGALAAGTGATLAFYVHEGPPETAEPKHWYDYELPGYITMGGGALGIVVGGVIFLAMGGDSGPTVGTTTAGDATIGWTGRF